MKIGGRIMRVRGDLSMTHAFVAKTAGETAHEARNISAHEANREERKVTLLALLCSP